MAIYHHHHHYRFIKPPHRPFAPPISNNNNNNSSNSIINLLIFLFLLLLLPRMSSSQSEAESLLQFKRSLKDPNHFLESWDVPGTEPCSPKGDSWWSGVFCSDGSVNGLRLESMKLSGKVNVDPLLNLSGLRTLSIQHNEFEGPIPAFNKLGVIKVMYVSDNKFSGKIPPDYFAHMGSMKKVWLSDNKFSGELPSSLTSLRNLIELHAENNQFTGKIPALMQPPLVNLNLSNNKLEGEIPVSLSKFNKDVFSGNTGLCGKSMGKVCPTKKKKSAPSKTTTKDDDDDDDEGVSGADSGGQIHNKVKTGEMKRDSSNSSNKTLMIILTVILIAVTLLLVVLLIIWCRDDDDSDDEEDDEDGPDTKVKVVEVHVSNPVLKSSKPATSAVTTPTAAQSPARRSDASSSGRGSSVKSSASGLGTGAMGDLIMVSKDKTPFGLADLMRASAEVLGNGVLGSAYKATMASGLSVAVKRIREMNRLGKDAFDLELKKLAALKHENVLSPLAYHYRKEEKLVIYEYVKRGSLRYILHGDKGRPQPELTWPARWKIIKGIARGMNYLHTTLSSNDLPHGNLKSSNVFVTEDNQALIAEFGFAPLINTTHLGTGLCAYKAPEAASAVGTEKGIGHKADVFTFGVMLLEILTGKFPSQYLPSSKGGTDVVQWVVSAKADNREVQLLDPEIANGKEYTEHMLRLLRVGAACTESDPEMRPDMHEAARRVEETGR